jgi:hypothetical protein
MNEELVSNKRLPQECVPTYERTRACVPGISAACRCVNTAAFLSHCATSGDTGSGKKVFYSLVRARKENLMLVLEVLRNGQLLCRAGGPWITLIHHSVSWNKGQDSFRLSSVGLNAPTNALHQHVQWLSRMPLVVGDEITFRVTESDTADAFETSTSYGTEELASGEKKHCCSFCGAEASTTNSLLLSPFANICAQCLRKHNPDRQTGS